MSLATTFAQSLSCYFMRCQSQQILTSKFCEQDKLEASEPLGDLLRRAGDNDAALAIYQKANVPGKVIEGLAAKGDFEALSKFRCVPYLRKHFH